MALANNASSISSRSLLSNSLSQPRHQPSFSLYPTNQNNRPRSRRPIKAVHAAEVAKKSVAAKELTPPVSQEKEKWTLDSWKSKNALQLPEYPDANDLESVLKTIEAFPPIVFAGEARSLEEKLAEAATGNAFLLQGGDCAESFKEFSANNIRDTFRVMLQMSVVLMFGGQMPIIKVRSNFGFCPLEKKN